MKKGVLAVLLIVLTAQVSYAGVKVYTKYKTPSQKPDIWWQLHNYWWPPTAITRPQAVRAEDVGPPAWLEAPSSVDLWKNLMARPCIKRAEGQIKSVFIYDVDQHQVLWAYNADARRPVLLQQPS